jgi:hypothetical protein
MKSCVVCKLDKQKECFTSGKNVCKICRASNIKNNRHCSRLAERENKRIEFFKLHLNENNFKDYFINEEDLTTMRLQKDLYDFCEVPEMLDTLERNTNPDFQQGYILKAIMVYDIKRASGYIRYII